MGAMSPIQADPIYALMPGIGRAEYRQRKRLKEAHDLALKMVTEAPDGTQRHIWMMLRDHTGAWVFQGAPLDVLTDAADIAVQIWKAAHQYFKMDEKIEGLTADGHG